MQRLSVLSPPSCLVLLLLPTLLSAQLPTARLSTFFPPGGQAGTSLDVTLAGADLEGLSELRFSHPGITAKPAAPPSEGERKPEARFAVTVAADVPPGLYEARAVGRYGVTNARAFAVGGAREIVRTAAEPMTMEIDAVVNARCTASAIDVYAFDAKAGQRVLIACDAREVDSRLAPVLMLSDAAGREIDRDRRGGIIDFTPAEDGRFTLRVHDLLYRGGQEYFYRLSVHTRPHIDAVLPPFGQPGTKGTYKLLGRNLPGGTRAGGATGADGKPLDELNVEIALPEANGATAGDALAAAWSATFDGFAYRLANDRGASNAVTIALAGWAAVTEADANDKPADAQAIDVPCELAGRFHPRGDRDWFAFDAKKGDAYWIEVTSERLGHPTAPFLLVQRAGKEAGQAEDVLESPDADLGLAGGSAVAATFRTASRDPAVRFEAKEDGRYRVMVRDLFNGVRDDATLTYRLSIRKAEPDFRVVAVPVGQGLKDNKEDPASASAPLLRKGGTLPIRVQVIRRDGFDGAVRVEAEGLAEGVTCPPVTIGGGEASGALLLTAADDAKGWAGTVRIVGKGKAGEVELVRPARFGAVVWAGAGAGGEGGSGVSGDTLRTRLTRDFALAVSEEEAAPISIAPAEDKAFEAVAGTKVSIPLKVVRRAEVKAAFKLKCAGAAALEKAKEVTIEPKADGGTLELDLSKEKLPPGTHTFHLQGPAQVKYARPPPPGDGKKGDEQGDGGKAKKKPESKDVQTMVYSRPITLTVTAAKEEEKPAKAAK